MIVANLPPLIRMRSVRTNLAVQARRRLMRMKQSPPLVGIGRAIKRVRNVALVVDDDRTLLDVARAILRMNGIPAVFASGGREALRQFESRDDIGAVLTDFTMPDMNGLALIRQLRARWAGLPAAVVSGADIGAKLKEIGGRLRIDRVIHKPFRLDELVHATRSLLRLCSSR